MTEEFQNNQGWEEESSEFWSEDVWEKELLRNEKMVERYRRILEDRPDLEGEDSFDSLFRARMESGFAHPLECVSEEEELTADTEPDGLDEMEEDAEDLYDGLEEIEAYTRACDLASEIFDFVRGGEGPAEDRKILDTLLVNSMKASANIAGGHGLGYERETICGNVVKNRWALQNIKTVIKTLDDLIFSRGPSPRLLSLSARSEQVRLAIQGRIRELRDLAY